MFTVEATGPADLFEIQDTWSCVKVIEDNCLVMDEQNTDEDDFVDDILSSLKQGNIVGIEQDDKKSSLLRNANQPLGLTQNETNGTVAASNESFELMLNTAEVILEDGLTINDVVNNELITFNEFECSPGTSHQVNQSEINSEAVGLSPSIGLSSLSFNTDEDKIDDPDDPDFVLSDTDVENNTESETEIVNNETSNSFVNSASNSISERPAIAIESVRSNEDDENVEIVQRKRKKRPDKSTWNVVAQKKLRMTGKKYIGYKKIKIDGKVVVKRSDEEREERKMGPMCSSRVCKANKNRKCTEINENIRKQIFQYFWPLSWTEKQVYIRAHVKKTKKKHNTLKDETKQSRRSGTYKYYLSSASGVFKPVCKLMFLNTLGLKEWMVHNWIKEKTVDSEDDYQGEDAVKPADGTASGSRKEKKISQKKKIISEWLDSLAKVPSHYCRASSTKHYLEPLWDSKVELYRTYKEFCTANDKQWGSLTTFMEVFEDKNFSIFKPKKDQCDLCYAFKAGNISQEVYNQHLTEKELARDEKDGDKKLAKGGQIHCLTADVQSVKLAPMTKANAMYYKTKLCSHNYTVYNLANRHCTCYWFTEVEGDLSANTFASCLTHYLKEHCLTPRLPITVYTDGCTNQNRNQFMSNALLHFAIQNEVEITQKYLIKGHTQMEGDSVHAKIENKIRGKDVYTPYEYVKYTKEARADPSPYHAMYLNHDFFSNFSNIKYYGSVRPGRKAGDPLVVDVHCFKYCPEGKIQYKLSFKDNFKDLPQRLNKVQKDLQPLKLFNDRIPLPSSKWNHLQDLKFVIPADFHAFYDSLPYEK